MRKSRKSKDLPNAHANDQRLEAELILLSKGEAGSRSGRHRRPGSAPFPVDTPELEGLPSAGEQLITQLADLDLNSQIRMSDLVTLNVVLPLWQVIELSSPGEFNLNLVALLNASLDNRAGDPAYLARLNAMILEAAQNETD